MKRVRLGRTGLSVSRVAFGGIPIMRLDAQDAADIIREALSLGINFIDTANAYADSESKIGAAIKGVRRDELVIATKSTARDRRTLLRHLDQSLGQLGVDYVDIYQLHNVSTADSRDAVFSPDGAYQGLLEAIQAGKVRFPAFSSHSLAMAVEIIKRDCFDVVQLPFNYIDTEALDEAIPLAKQMDIGFIAMKPMGGGMLHDAGLSFRYLLQFDSIVPDPGIEKIAEIREIAGIVNSPEAFSAEDQARVEKLREELGGSWCHRCDYCQPCPQGISISSVLTSQSFLKRFSFDRAQAMVGADIEQARSCAECRDCVSRCPYGLDIPLLLRQGVDYWDAYSRDLAGSYCSG